MCGRFALFSVGESLSNWFDVEVADNITTRYNIAPTQDVPIITNDQPSKLQIAKWGLIPKWAKDDKIAYSTINARFESIQQKPAYKLPFKTQRGLIPTNGFYEWKKEGSKKTPFYFKLKSNNLFAFAGIFDIWKNSNGDLIKSFSIITLPANDIVKPIHDRMPAILKREHEILWLNNSTPEKLLEILLPYPSKNLISYQVSNLINSPKNEGNNLINPFIKVQSSLSDF